MKISIDRQNVKFSILNSIFNVFSNSTIFLSIQYMNNIVSFLLRFQSNLH